MQFQDATHSREEEEKRIIHEHKYSMNRKFNLYPGNDMTFSLHDLVFKIVPSMIPPLTIKTYYDVNNETISFCNI